MISVCMATYNGEKYIQEQIESIIMNLSSNDEIVISDDGSKDNTIAIIKSYKNKFPNIKIFKGPGKGVIHNFENAIINADGDLIYLSDQDDIWEANKVETVNNCFENRKIKLVVHNALIVDGQGKSSGKDFFEFRNSHTGLVKNLLKNSYIGCCMAFRKNLAREFLPFPENIEMHDWWIGLVSELTNGSYFLDEQLIRYRRHDGNVSPMHHHPIGKMVQNRIVLCTELAQRYKLIKNYR